MKRFCFKFIFFLWVVTVWLFIGYLVNTLCFGAARRSAPRYKIAPTNAVVRIDGTNCWVRYMYDRLLDTNLIISCEPFDPPPAANTNDYEEASND